MAIPEQQRDTAAFLARVAGRPPIETHISAVFVGENTAWKLKKAVRLPFLDFTCITARRHFAERELTLNQPVAPEIYRDVVAIERDVAGQFAFVPASEVNAPVDWVLRMAPIAPDDVLTAIADRHALTPRLLDQLGDCVALDHERRPPAPSPASAAAFGALVDNCVIAASRAGLSASLIKQWRGRIAPLLARQMPSLEQRAASGHVRRCHGDLHLGNICLWNGAPVPFDALEFDEALATIDVGYDLAFLLMDLDQSVGRAAANRVFNRYIARTGDSGIAGPMPVFMSLRAMVRAFTQAEAGHLPGGQRFLEAACSYLAETPVLLIAIGGLPGSGKSTLARSLAPWIGSPPGAVIIRSDEIRKRRFGVAPEQHLPDTAYTPASDHANNAVLVHQTREIVGGGHTVIADATFLDTADRGAMAMIGLTAHVPFLGIWLAAPMELLQSRLRTRAGDASDADGQVLRLASRRQEDAVSWTVVDATDGDTALVHVEALLAALELPPPLAGSTGKTREL